MPAGAWKLVAPGMLPSGAYAASKVDAPRHWLEMARIDAGAVPAQMVEVESLGNRPNQQFIGKAMSANPLIGSRCKIAVSPVSDSADPNPASVRLIDALPEAFFGGPTNAATIHISMTTHAGVMHDAHTVPPRRFRALINGTGAHGYMVAETWGVS